ncbi:hypothetical protein J6590_019226 [Homalodisca vitripennis]|nr:hypothetical protein J6590_019226 [Homalodisca vitripennis]
MNPPQQSPPEVFQRHSALMGPTTERNAPMCKLLYRENSDFAVFQPLSAGNDSNLAIPRGISTLICTRLRCLSFSILRYSIETCLTIFIPNYEVHNDSPTPNCSRVNEVEFSYLQSTRTRGLRHLIARESTWQEIRHAARDRPLVDVEGCRCMYIPGDVSGGASLMTDHGAVPPKTGVGAGLP